MHSTVAVCAVLWALLPTALSRTVETGFVSIPKGGWHVFEVAADWDHTLLHNIVFTNRASAEGCKELLQGDIILGVVTVPAIPITSGDMLLPARQNATSNFFVGRNAVAGAPVTANVSSANCSVDLRAEFNFYSLLNTTVDQEAEAFKVSEKFVTVFHYDLLPTAVYVESISFTVLTPCSAVGDAMLTATNPSSCLGSQPVNLTEAGWEMTMPVEGTFQEQYPGDRRAVVGIGIFHRGDPSCIPEVKLSMVSRTVLVPGTAAPPTITPTQPPPLVPTLPPTPLPIPTWDGSDCDGTSSIQLVGAGAVGAAVGACLTALLTVMMSRRRSAYTEADRLLQ